MAATATAGSAKQALAAAGSRPRETGKRARPFGSLAKAAAQAPPGSGRQVTGDRGYALTGGGGTVDVAGASKPTVVFL